MNQTMPMIRSKFVFLTLSLVALAIGFCNVGQNVFVYLGLPVGAILFGLFMIFQVLEKESTLFEEQQYSAQRLPQPRRPPQPELRNRRKIKNLV